jgi:uncharacterized protein (TIGR00369 family)
MPTPTSPAPDPAPPVFNPAYRDRLFTLINEAPFVRHMGMRVTELAWGLARFEQAPAPSRMQPFGVVHGGNIAALIDSAAFWACYMALPDDRDAMTSVDLKLNYLAATRQEPLHCLGKLIKAGRTLSYAEAEVRTPDGRLVAHGTSTLMRLTDQGLRLGPPMWLAPPAADPR